MVVWHFLLHLPKYSIYKLQYCILLVIFCLRRPVCPGRLTLANKCANLNTGTANTHADILGRLTANASSANYQMLQLYLPRYQTL